MPKLDLTDEEQTAVAAALRRLIDEDKFPFAPRLKPLKSPLAKLDPKPVKPRTELPPPPQPGDRPRYGPPAKKSRRWVGLPKKPRRPFRASGYGALSKTISTTTQPASPRG